MLLLLAQVDVQGVARRPRMKKSCKDPLKEFFSELRVSLRDKYKVCRLFIIYRFVYLKS